MKAGTTWLHQQLVSHEEIHFCPEKEIHYFADPDGHNYMSLHGRVDRFQQVARNLNPEKLSAHVQCNLSWYATKYLAREINDDWYSSLFDLRKERKKPNAYCADFSNLYCNLNSSSWEHVRRVASHVRAIYTMRHPAKRLWSQLKFSYEFGGKAHELDSLKADDYKAFLSDAGTVAHSDYSSVVENLKQHLDDSEVKFFFFENFRDKPQESLKDIEDFLGIGHLHYSESKLNKRINPSQTRNVPESFQHAVTKIHMRQIELLDKHGLEVPSSWLQPSG